MSSVVDQDIAPLCMLASLLGGMGCGAITSRRQQLEGSDLARCNPRAKVEITLLVVLFGKKFSRT
jgi:hypothetical protein